MALWITRHTAIPLIPTFTQTPGATTNHPTSRRLCFPPWHRGPELFATRIAFTELEFLKLTFRQNSYSDRQIHRTLSTDPDLIPLLP
jgi:hypothetical protein